MTSPPGPAIESPAAGRVTFRYQGQLWRCRRWNEVPLPVRIAIEASTPIKLLEVYSALIVPDQVAAFTVIFPRSGTLEDLKALTGLTTVLAVAMKKRETRP